MKRFWIRFGIAGGQSDRRGAAPQLASSHHAEPQATAHAKIALVIALALVLASPLRADSITFSGSSIPLPGCVIEGWQAGQVLYRDRSGSRQRRPLEEIRALGFDKLTALDEAEAALANDDVAAGLEKLLVAMVAASTDVQRTWIHARLAQVHDGRGEYVQAAGHLGALAALSDDGYWRTLEPVSPQNEPDYAAAKEALENLQRASRSVKSAELKAAIERLLWQVQPIHDRQAKAYRGPRLEPGSTVSGIAKSKILAGEAEAPVPPPSDAPVPPPAAAPVPSPAGAPPAATRPGEPQRPAPPPRVASPPASTSPAARPAPPSASASDGPRDPDGIDPLLGKGQWAEALARCETAAGDPKALAARDLPHFLYQYGMALSRSRRPRDAAIQFTRCAVLFPEAPDAVHCLIETAVIYRDEYRKPQVAARLLARAISDATTRGDDAAAALARELRR